MFLFIDNLGDTWQQGIHTIKGQSMVQETWCFISHLIDTKYETS